MLKLLGLLFLTSCSHLFYQPDAALYSFPHRMDLKFDEGFLDIKKVKLHYWKLAPEKGKVKGTILFFHGNAQNVSAHFYQVWYLTKFGYEVILWDYRGFGVSTGSPNQKDIFNDGLQVLDWAYKEHLKNKTPKFIVYAQSLGGVISLPIVASSSLKEKIDLFIIESSFMSYQDIAFDKLKLTWLSWPFSPLAYLLVSDGYASDKYIHLLEKTKLLYIHSKADYVVPYKFGEELYQKYPGKKEFWSYEQLGHIGIFHYDKERRKLVNYLDKL